MMSRPTICAAIGAAALAGSALAGTQFDASLDAGVVIGSGIPNSNFVVNTDNGVQTGIKALERFIGDLPNSGSTFRRPRQSHLELPLLRRSGRQPHLLRCASAGRHRL